MSAAVSTLAAVLQISRFTDLPSLWPSARIVVGVHETKAGAQTRGEKLMFFGRKYNGLLIKWLRAVMHKKQAGAGQQKFVKEAL